MGQKPIYQRTGVDPSELGIQLFPGPEQKRKSNLRVFKNSISWIRKRPPLKWAISTRRTSTPRENAIKEDHFFPKGTNHLWYAANQTTRLNGSELTKLGATMHAPLLTRAGLCHGAKLTWQNAPRVGKGVKRSSSPYDDGTPNAFNRDAPGGLKVRHPSRLSNPSRRLSSCYSPVTEAHLSG